MIEEMKQGLDTLKQVFLGTDTPPEDAISLLKEDHRKVEDLFKKFEEAEGKAERRSLLDEIIAELTVHAGLEEKLVYPLLFFEDTEDKTKEAFEEHHVVKLLLTELEGFSGSEDNVKAKVKVLAEMVKHHIKEEELDLLPKLKDHGVDLDVLGATLKDSKKDLERQIESLKKQAAQEAKQAVGTGNGSGKSADSEKASLPQIEKAKSESKSVRAKIQKASSASKAKAKSGIAGKKAAAEKPATRGSAKEKTGNAKKPAAKKVALKKPAATKPATKKAAAGSSSKAAAKKKTAKKKAATRKAAAKKPAAKKTAAKKSGAKKPAAKTATTSRTRRAA